MMHLALLLAAALLACARVASGRHTRLLPDDDPLSPPKQNRKFLTLSNRPPPVVVHKPGSVLELTCEAIGSPAPTVRWYRNTSPVHEHDVESNEVLEANPTSFARISSTLLVPRVANREDEYTCVVSNGFNTVPASTTVMPEDSGTESEERTKLAPLKPRILVYYSTVVDIMGNDLVLPCKTRGHPRPHVFWTDNRGFPIAHDDPRIKVLRSGELVILSLRWSDLGEYTCHATNDFGSHDIRTFVYPAKAG